MKRPNNAKTYEPIDLKLGIKSSLPSPKATLAMLLLIWELSGKPSMIEYGYESGDKLVLRKDLRDNLKAKLDSLSVDIPDDVFDNIISNNPLLKSQIESLMVAFELVWRVAKIRFTNGLANSTERTGQKRFSKTIYFSNNLDLLDAVVEDSDDSYKTLFAWLGFSVAKNDSKEKYLIRSLDVFSEDALFKLDNASNNVIFNMESLYDSIINDDPEIDIYGDGEEKGSLRILHSALSDGLFSHLSKSGHCVSAVNQNLLKDYYERVKTYHGLVTSKDKLEKVPADAGATNTTSSKIADNIILYGVPGCGKSHKIKTEYCDKEELMERVVFHPDYTYSDFVGQILPENDNGHISYPFVPGPFTRILKKAVDDPESNYYLIIEELNRGNAPAIFGEVFQLLDRVDGVSEYGINNADIALKVYNDASHQVRLPKNLFILATMNTADQNVFTLDTAFKRRWKMRSITNDINGCFFGGYAICGSNISWKSFLKTINDKIIELGEGNIGSEDKRLGAYFVQPSELSDIDAFAEKVLMYLWNDAFKYDHDKVFKAQYKTLEQLILGFKSHLFGIFNDNLVFTADCSETLYDPSDDDSTSIGSSTAIWIPCSDVVKSWVERKRQQPDSEITSVLIKRGVTYKRFTTKLFDRLIPLSTSNTSGWNTTNHYFYEIVLKNNKLYVQFVCNISPNTPQNVLDAFENVIFPVTNRKLNEGLQWYCNRICDTLPVTPDIEDDKITAYLEKCYDNLVEFEKAFSSDTTVNG